MVKWSMNGQKVVLSGQKWSGLFLCTNKAMNISMDELDHQRSMLPLVPCALSDANMHHLRFASKIIIYKGVLNFPTLDRFKNHWKIMQIVRKFRICWNIKHMSSENSTREFRWKIKCTKNYTKMMKISEILSFLHEQKPEWWLIFKVTNNFHYKFTNTKLNFYQIA